MQVIKSIANLLFILIPFCATAQSTYLMPGDKAEALIERLQIKQQTNTDLNFSTLRPLARKAAVEEVQFLDSARLGYIDSMGVDKYRDWTDLSLTSVDEYNIQRLFMNNREWYTGNKEGFESKKAFLNAFYKTKVNMVEVDKPNFFLAINPMIQFSQAVEPGYDQSIFLNSRGIAARGLIAKKIGFSTFLTDNQERGPQFVQQEIAQSRAVPGVGFYKDFKKTGVDYFDARGYITFGATKYINIQFGHDKNFIGNGYRSLFLSDWGNSYLFAKINTRIWKLNYQNLFMELTPQFVKTHDTLLDRKYAVMHHLSMNVTKWLNIGVFEGVVFGRKNHFDFQYLNPIIFYRHIEGSAGSPDNALLGLDAKANIAHRLQLYGQFIMDEFILSKVKGDPTNWVNKFGMQFGLKYIDAFNIRNLDLQIEANRVRPFTYSHNDSISNYTHYNQPLAHPLGANFQEVLFKIRYQPAPKWFVDARGFYFYKGLDSMGVNMGGNIFELNNTKTRESGYTLGGGSKATCLNGIITISHELRDNLFIDVSAQYRNYKIAGLPGESNTTLVTAGIRLNMAKRVYDF